MRKQARVWRSKKKRHAQRDGAGWRVFVVFWAVRKGGGWHERQEEKRKTKHERGREMLFVGKITYTLQRLLQSSWS